jgi:3-hydroxybutyryl-CoA dehydratase
VKHIDPQELREWAEVLRDPNPIHLDPQAVVARGLGNRVISQGPANLALIITMLQTAHPGARLSSLDVRYLDNVFAGDTVEPGFEVTATEGSRVTCKVWLNTAIQGTAVLERDCQ